MSNREEFEAEWVKIIGEVPKAIRFSDDEGGYIIAYDSLKNEPNTRFLVNALNVSLHMWQARVPEGYVVVPVDNNEGELKRICNVLGDATVEYKATLVAKKSMIEAAEK